MIRQLLLLFINFDHIPVLKPFIFKKNRDRVAGALQPQALTEPGRAQLRHPALHSIIYIVGGTGVRLELYVF